MPTIEHIEPVQEAENHNPPAPPELHIVLSWPASSESVTCLVVMLKQMTIDHFCESCNLVLNIWYDIYIYKYTEKKKTGVRACTCV